MTLFPNARHCISSCPSWLYTLFYKLYHHSNLLQGERQATQTLTVPLRTIAMPSQAMCFSSMALLSLGLLANRSLLPCQPLKLNTWPQHKLQKSASGFIGLPYNSLATSPYPPHCTVTIKLLSTLLWMTTKTPYQTHQHSIPFYICPTQI